MAKRHDRQPGGERKQRRSHQIGIISRPSAAVLVALFLLPHSQTHTRMCRHWSCLSDLPLSLLRSTTSASPVVPLSRPPLSLSHNLDFRLNPIISGTVTPATATNLQGTFRRDILSCSVPLTGLVPEKNCDLILHRFVPIPIPSSSSSSPSSSFRTPFSLHARRQQPQPTWDPQHSALSLSSSLWVAPPRQSGSTFNTAHQTTSQHSIL